MLWETAWRKWRGKICSKESQADVFPFHQCTEAQACKDHCVLYHKAQASGHSYHPYFSYITIKMVTLGLHNWCCLLPAQQFSPLHSGKNMVFKPHLGDCSLWLTTKSSKNILWSHLLSSKSQFFFSFVVLLQSCCWPKHYTDCNRWVLRISVVEKLQGYKVKAEDRKKGENVGHCFLNCQSLPHPIAI